MKKTGVGYVIRMSLMVAIVISMLWFTRSQAAIIETAEVTPFDRDEVILMTHSFPRETRDALFVKYLVASMQHWRKPDKLSADYTSIANDIFDVARDERPLGNGDFANPEGASVLMAAIGFYETGFKAYADDGRCSKLGALELAEARSHGAIRVNLSSDDRKLLKHGSCDGGKAHTIFQIWSADGRGIDGIVLFNDKREWMYESGYRGKFTDSDVMIVHAKELDTDRKAAVRTAMHMVRKSMQYSDRLCSYTGETKECPLGRARIAFARDWLANHSFRPGS